MNKLSKAQRDQLIGIAMGTIALMVALWYFGVTAKQKELAALRKKSSDNLALLSQHENFVRLHYDDDVTLRNRTAALTNCEAQLSPDQDTYPWLMNTLNNSLQTRKAVNIDSSPAVISEVVPVGQAGQVGLIPNFPYRWATFHVKATGYYHDLGKFFADLEKNLPYFRIENPNFSANAGPGMEPEKLSVVFDLVTPVANSPDTK